MNLFLNYTEASWQTPVNKTYPVNESRKAQCNGGLIKRRLPESGARSFIVYVIRQQVSPLVVVSSCDVSAQKHYSMLLRWPDQRKRHSHQSLYVVNSY